METEVIIIIKLKRNLYKFVYYLLQHIKENIWYKVLSTTNGDEWAFRCKYFSYGAITCYNTHPANVTLPKGTKHFIKAL